MTTLIKAYLAAPKAKGGDASVLREPADVAMQIPLQNFTGVCCVKCVCVSAMCWWWCLQLCVLKVG